ncbi:hypothetical protein EGM51_07570 [Verrucomicrobia bacterium S94]|nr:hypothetical protein EGM51_07570 [Verrucomicrobia bacterium S94]
MKKTITAVAVMLACGTAMSALYSTSFDSPTYTSGNLSGQDGWVAQTQWQVDGAGNVTNTSGAFIRAHNTNVLGSTAINEVMTLTSVLTLGTYTTPSADIASWEEGIFTHAMSHQQGSASFAADLAVGLHYNASTGNLELRAAQGQK